jgi:hypothetical protein
MTMINYCIESPHAAMSANVPTRKTLHLLLFELFGQEISRNGQLRGSLFANLIGRCEGASSNETELLASVVMFGTPPSDVHFGPAV